VNAQVSIWSFEAVYSVPSLLTVDKELKISPTHVVRREDTYEDLTRLDYDVSDPTSKALNAWRVQLPLT
jgi:hypothetical protein